MRIGVIDIGYNAIRAAAYEDDKISSREIYSNKFKNDILSLLTCEEIDIKHQTYLYISHILKIFNNLDVEKFACVATAVLRNHPKAQEFIDLIHQKYNFTIEIISGQREAELMAKGLLVGTPMADGFAIDLGGGSLEIATISNGSIGKAVSLNLGTQIIANRNLDNLEILTNQIKKDLLANNISVDSAKNLYFIGGALRFISRLYIDYAKLPLRNLHNLTICADKFDDFLTNINGPKLAKVKIGKRHISPNAVLVARALISNFQPKNISVSTYGLKEGLKYEMLGSPPSKDIIKHKLALINSYNIANTDFQAYLNILNQVFSHRKLSEYESQILEYTMICLKSNCNYDQTIPPQAQIESILSSEIQFTHKQRVMLALTINYASNFKICYSLLSISKKKLSKEENIICQILGFFIRICLEVDGPFFTTPRFTLVSKNNYLEINTEEILPRPTFEKVREKLKQIAFATRQVK